MSEEKIAITGGTGFIGQYLIEQYGDDIHFVVPTSKKDTSGYSKKAEYVYSDYSLESFYDVFRGCMAVIHLGGKVMNGMDYDLKTEAYSQNLSLCEKVFMACKNQRISNVVFSSSVAVYDQRNDNPVDESAFCQPNSMYGIMKIAAEKLAELFNRRYDMNIKILRIAQVLGVHDTICQNSFWDTMLVKCLKKEKITIFGEGKTGRDVIYVKDVADALVLAVRKTSFSGIVNIGSGAIASNKDIAEAFCKAFGLNNNLEFNRNASESGIRTFMNCQRAKDELGFSAKYSLEEMSKDMKVIFTKKYSDGL